MCRMCICDYHIWSLSKSSILYDTITIYHYELDQAWGTTGLAHHVPHWICQKKAYPPCLDKSSRSNEPTASKEENMHIMAKSTNTLTSSGWWFQPLWKMMEFVSWDYDIPNIRKSKIHVPDHQPDNVGFTKKCHKPSHTPNIFMFQTINQSFLHYHFWSPFS